MTTDPAAPWVYIPSNQAFSYEPTLTHRTATLTVHDTELTTVIILFWTVDSQVVLIGFRKDNDEELEIDHIDVPDWNAGSVGNAARQLATCWSVPDSDLLTDSIFRTIAP